MKIEKQIRKEIFEKVKELYELRKSKERFIPGKIRINYAGRVCKIQFKKVELVYRRCHFDWSVLR